MIVLRVYADSEEVEAKWMALEQHLPGLRLEVDRESEDYCRFLQASFEREGKRPFAVCHGRVWLGDSFGPRLHRLRERLEAAHVPWGVVGCAGSLVDRPGTIDFGGRPGRPLASSRTWRHVELLEPSVLFFQGPALREAGFRPSPARGGVAAGSLLALEVRRCGLLPLVDPHLYCRFDAGGPPEDLQAAFGAPEVQEALGREGIGGTVFTPWGAVEGPRAGGGRKPVERTLGTENAPAPLLAIVCRTQFTRPEMLERLLASIEGPAAALGPDAVLVLLISDRDAEDIEAAARPLRERHAGLRLHTEARRVPAGFHSRTHLLREGIAACTCDYLWIVDDDDFLLAEAIPTVLAAIGRSPEVFVHLVNSKVAEERWSEEAEERHLVSQEWTARHDSRRYLECLWGMNSVPICGAVYRTSFLQAAVAGADWRGDVAEDYFLFLTALLQQDFRVGFVPGELVAISIRQQAEENSVTAHRDGWWRHSAASFLGSALARAPQSDAFWDALELAGGPREGEFVPGGVPRVRGAVPGRSGTRLARPVRFGIALAGLAGFAAEVGWVTAVRVGWWQWRRGGFAGFYGACLALGAHASLGPASTTLEAFGRSPLEELRGQAREWGGPESKGGMRS